MKRTLLLFPVLFALFFAGLMFHFPYIPEYPDAIYVFSAPCDTIPELNQKIVGIVKQQIGKTVDRGECWDLAALVLNQTGAKWDRQYTFGRNVDLGKECACPGDLIQFEGVMIKYTKGRTVFEETMSHHTAIIFEVKAKDVFVLAHQNTGTSGRKVGLSDIDIKTIIKGKYQIFRPVQ